MRYPWPVAGPGRATRGRPTLQTSSNHHDLNRLTKTPVTNVVNPSPKTTIISEKALRLTTFVTTDQKSTQKTPWIDDVCNNTPPATLQRHSAAGVEGAGGTGGPDCGARGRRRSLAGLRADAQAHVSTPGPTGVEGAGGTGGHGRASRRGAERSEALASRAAGPSGAWNTRGATSNTITRAGHRPPAHTAAGPSGARNTGGATSNNQGKQKPQIPKDLRFHRARGGS